MAADLVIIDEITMLTKDSLRVINQLLQRLMNNQLPFGGKAIVISGDFRQTLPVVRRGQRAAIIEACIKSSRLWDHFVELSLISNMRSTGHRHHNDWVLNIGSGTTGQIDGLRPEMVELPRHMVINRIDHLIDTTFGHNLENLHEEDLSARVILCTTNRDCLHINNQIIGGLAGDMKIYNSADTIISDDDEVHTIYNEEFLHNLQLSGLPPHELRLKKRNRCYAAEKFKSEERIMQRHKTDCTKLTGKFHNL